MIPLASSSKRSICRNGYAGHGRRRARRDHSRMIVDGLAAANDLGLTTAVPARVTVLTDARLRPIQIGKQRIVFQTVATKRLYWAGRPAMRVVQALYWLKDILNSGDAQTVRRLHRVLA